MQLVPTLRKDRRDAADVTVVVELWPKVLDGDSRPKWQVALAVLESFGLVTPGEIKQLAAYRLPILRNHRGLDVGRLSTELPER